MQRPKIVEISRVQHQHCTWPLSLPHCCRHSVYNVHVRTERAGGELAGIVRSLVHGNHTSTGPSLFAIYASEIPKIGALLPVRPSID